jgi:hypothetical protein
MAAMQAPISQQRINVCTRPKSTSTGEILILIMVETSTPCSSVLKNFTVLSGPNMSMTIAQPKYSNAPVKPNANPNRLMMM